MKYTLNREDVRKWIRNMALFAAPLALVYLAQVQGTISQPGNVIELADFVPNQVTQGAMMLYVVNAVTDILKKFIA